jgi:hypothetical protein
MLLQVCFVWEISMLRTSFAIGATALLLSSAAFSQQPATPSGAPPAGTASNAAARPAPIPLEVPNPHYISIPMTIDVNAPVDEVWARIGKFCDIAEWEARGSSCTMLSGTDGEFGAVRSVGNELLVGRTKYSYTYEHARREGVPFDLYHGTLEAVALTDKTTRLNYTLFFDNSMLADDAARQADVATRRATFMRYLGNMKILAEGGHLQPPAPPLAPPASGPGQATPPLMDRTAHYVSIPMTVEVNAPVAKVWARIGKYCDIGEWGIPGCTILSGTAGEFGAVRSIGNEVLVGKTQYSYVYTQPVRATGVYNMYHGTLEARALTSTTTQLIYTLLYDNSSLADDAARETDMNNRRTLFTKMLNNMKTLSEGETLPPGAVGR